MRNKHKINNDKILYKLHNEYGKAVNDFRRRYGIETLDIQRSVRDLVYEYSKRYDEALDIIQFYADTNNFSEGACEHSAITLGLDLKTYGMDTIGIKARDFIARCGEDIGNEKDNSQLKQGNKSCGQ